MKDLLVAGDYVGVFLAKRHASGVSDGTAIFWKDAKFTMLDKLEIEGTSWNQVAVSVLLQNADKFVVVTSTHLKAYQTADEEMLRVEQVKRFLKLQEEWITEAEVDVSLRVFAGDLNSCCWTFPQVSSHPWRGKALFELLKSGYKSSYHEYEDWGCRNVSQMVSVISEKALYDYIFNNPSPSVNVRIDDCDPLPEITESEEDTQIHPTLSGHDPISTTLDFW